MVVVSIPTNQKLKENTKFIQMVKEFGVRKSTINFLKLRNKYLNINNSSVFLNIMKNCIRPIKKICEENASEFQ